MATIQLDRNGLSAYNYLGYQVIDDGYLFGGTPVLPLPSELGGSLNRLIELFATEFVIFE